MELFLLGLAVGTAGGLLGTRARRRRGDGSPRKRLVRLAARGYVAVADRAKGAAGRGDGSAELEEPSPASRGAADAATSETELNRTQAAERLGVAVSSLRYYERKGKLHP